jgi:predicted O-methyltransferase YrrM
MIYENIQGWFDFPDLYDEMITKYAGKPHVTFVEVGVWKGKSASYMAERIKNSAEDFKFYCVDTFEGSYDEEQHQKDPLVESGTLYDHFIDNMTGLEKFFTPMVMDSVKAASQFDDNSLDFVFIDANHSYDGVSADLKAWIPKIKKDGFIAGHDYNNVDVRKAVHDQIPAAQGCSRHCWIRK